MKIKKNTIYVQKDLKVSFVECSIMCSMLTFHLANRIFASN